MDWMAQPSGGGLSDIATNGQNLNANISKLITTLQAILPFSGSVGTFTAAAAASTTVNDVNVKANSFIALMETNAAAGTLQATSERLYVSARTAGTSFTVSTSDGGDAAGTETFSYVIINVA